MDNKNRQGLLSVVLPSFNEEASIPRAAETVSGILTRAGIRHELIFVDDGSTDGTLSVAEGYREKFAARGYTLRIVEGEHKNASAAINRGLPFVTGEYLIWPDSDDVLERESVERRVRFLEENNIAHKFELHREKTNE